MRTQIRNIARRLIHLHQDWGINLALLDPSKPVVFLLQLLRISTTVIEQKEKSVRKVAIIEWTGLLHEH